MSNIHIDELAFVYLTIRDQIEAAEARHKLELKPMEDDLTALEQALLAACNAMGDDVKSVNTGSGTVMRQLKERYSCGDWDGFNKFVVENGVPELFERRIAQGNMKTFLKANEDAGLPPGVSVFREYKISVRRPTQSAE
jgi:hypothetical protein